MLPFKIIFYRDLFCLYFIELTWLEFVEIIKAIANSLCDFYFYLFFLYSNFIWSFGLCSCKSFWSYVFQVIFYCHELDFEALSGLVFLYVKGSERLCFTYRWFLQSNFLWFFISATWMYSSSYPGHGCHLPSEVWNGENCCFCSFNIAADWTCCWTSFCNCAVSYKGVGLPGIFNIFHCHKAANFSCICFTLLSLLDSVVPHLIFFYHFLL